MDTTMKTQEPLSEAYVLRLFAELDAYQCRMEQRMKANVKIVDELHIAGYFIIAMYEGGASDALEASNPPKWRTAQAFTNSDSKGLQAIGTLMQLKVCADAPEIVSQAVTQLHKQFEALLFAEQPDAAA